MALGLGLAIPDLERRSATRQIACALLASTALAAVLPPGAARAQAIWEFNPTVAGPVGGTFDFNAGANWNTGTVPTGTAVFGLSNGHDLSFSAVSTTIGGWTFNPGASNDNYTFSLDQTLTFNGAGIDIIAGSAAITVNSGGAIQFNNSSTADSATITNTSTGVIGFNGDSTAGNATINANGSGFLAFSDNSSAGSATINNNNNNLSFSDNSTAGSATIINNGVINFLDNSTAGSAGITNNGGLGFSFTSSAGSAEITNNGTVQFNGSSTAGGAEITTNSGATTQFLGSSTGGAARFITNAGGTFDMSGLGLAGMTAGSIEGAGTYFLGSKVLTVGNNLPTEVSGVISDGGFFGGTGGSLVKVGTGTLTLSGANTYSGGTTINGGAVNVRNNAALGTGPVTVASGAALELQGGVAVARPLTLNGSGLSNGGALRSVSGNNTYDAAILLASDASIISDAGSTLTTNAAGSITTISNTFTLTLGGDGNGVATAAPITAGFLVKDGAGTWTIGNAGNAIGLTTVNAGILQLTAQYSNPDSAAFVVNTPGTLQVTNSMAIGSLAGGGGVVLQGPAVTLTTGGDNNSTIFSGVISEAGGVGSLVKTGTGTLTLLGNNTYTGGTTVNGGTLVLGDATNTATIRGAVANNNATLHVINADVVPITTITNTASAGGGASLSFFSGASAGSGTITSTATGAGSFASVLFNDSSSAGSAVITSEASGGGTAQVVFAGNSTAADSAITLASDGASALRFIGGSSAGDSRIVNNGAGVDFQGGATAANATIANNGGSVTFGGTTTAGTARIANNGGFLAFGGSSDAQNAVIVNNAVFSILDNASGGRAAVTNNAGATFRILALIGAGTTVGSIGGAGNILLGDRNLTFGSLNTDTEISGVISGAGGSLTKAGTGTTVLSGNNTYTGATTVNGGVLLVNGFNGDSAAIVNAGGTLGGTGTVGPTAVNGGTLAPGNSIGTITVQGNLTFGAGGVYQVEVSPADADRTNVTGSASLAGTVQAVALAGSFSPRSYTILNAAGGVSGQFGSLIVTGTFGNELEASLQYDNNNVFLVLAAGQITPPLLTGATINQNNVAQTINGAALGGAPVPAAFDVLLNLPPAGVQAALTQLDGEVATGMQQAGFKALDLFLGVMLNPFLHGRGEIAGGGPALAFAPERQALPRDAQAAYAAAMPVKAPPLAPATFGQRWSVWGSAYGGTSNTDGDAIVGSHDTRTNAYGFAAGVDHRLTPDTLIGFALAGGGTSWSLSGSLGSGSSDMFQAGIYGSHRFAGSAYISAAAAYTWHDASTNRNLTLAGVGQLDADFDAHSFGARLEGGYRWLTPLVGITPYAAAQVLSIRTPGYLEAGLLGAAPFALNYASRSTTATRTELGFWFDRSVLLNPDTALTLRARAAWAHEFDDERDIAATFQTLPLASFTVFGASPAQDYALLSGAADLRMRNGWSFALKGDAELSGRTQTFSGNGTVRYAW